MHSKFKLSVISAAAIVPAAFMALGAFAAGGNLLTNGTFDASTSGWSTYSGFPTATLGWSAGHAVVTNTSDLDTGTLGAAVQCVDVAPSQTYQFAGSAYVPGAQKRSGGAETRVFFYAGANCTGAVITSPFGSYMGSTPAAKDTWIPFNDAIASPAGASSALIMIMAAKDKPAGLEKKTDPLAVQFDNVSFSPKLEKQVPTITPKTPTATPTPVQTVIANPTSTPSPTATPDQPTPAGTPVIPANPGNGGNGGGAIQGNTNIDPTPADPGSGEPVKTLGDSEVTPARTADAPLAPSTGSGGQHASQPGGLIDWQVFGILTVGVLALAGLVVTLGTVIAARHRDEDDEQVM